MLKYLIFNFDLI